MDRSWIQLKNRLHVDYREGVKKFLEFAFAHIEPGSKILCPCLKCNNCYRKSLEEVDAHLLVFGIVRSYTRWVHHGEEFEYDSDNDDDYDNDNGIEGQQGEEDVEDDDMQEMINDIATGMYGDSWQGFDSTSEGPGGVHEREETFVGLLREARQQLYPGCEKFSRLSFIVKLLHIKIMNNWTNKSFNMLLELLKEALPDGEILPGSYAEAKNLIHELGLGYIKIHACEFDCALFWNEHKDLDNCPKCQTSRWNFKGSKKIPKKVLRYFPLKPMLQRLFVNSNIAKDMCWHKEKRMDEINVSRHPADSPLWKDFDEKHKLFAEDPRNVRLGLASDGFNPFGNMSNAYSIWPVIVTPYNLPPWRCMKDPFLFLSMLIPGPKSPSSNIHVYLQPLIDELNELWEVGIKTYDASGKQNFQLHAALIGTINDFPALGMLSGWSTKGKLACPVCMGETTSRWLANGKKHCYMGHRRFLPMDHKWRDMEDKFDGQKDFRDMVKVLSGEEIFDQLASIQPVEYGNHPGRKKRKRDAKDLNWTNKSVFFDLPYWKTLKIRHMLDVMHIQKNVCDNILGTLMNIEGKTKDNWKSRRDLEILDIRPELHMRSDGDSFVLPPACYNLSRDEKRRICEFLTSVKFPDNFASNISRCVNKNECRISGMKSHDCHVFLHRLLPLAIRGVVRKDLCQALIELSKFFQELCSKSLRLDELERLERQIPITLCKLEQIFPPSFFDVMVHLPIHLVNEAKVAGPVQYRWMFPIERFLRKLKRFVRNKARPEGSIAEGYIDYQCLTFCSLYLHDIETSFNRVERNYDGGSERQNEVLSVFASNGYLFSRQKEDELNLEDWQRAHMYVLNNCDEVTDYIIEHKEEISRESERNVNKRHESTFPRWFEERVSKLYYQGIDSVSDQLLSLARGPDKRVFHYKGCNINGLRFHSKDREMERKTQNSGVVVQGEHEGKNIDFYGVLKDIIELRYIGGYHVTLFMCDWWDVSGKRSGLYVDKDFNVTSINMRKTWYDNQPYVLASQVGQVFYVPDMKLGNDWHIVQRSQPRSSYDVPHKEDEESDIEDEPYQQNESHGVLELLQIDDERVPLERDDIFPEVRVDTVAMSSEEMEDLEEDSFSDDFEVEGDHVSSDDEVEEDDMNMADDSDSD